MKVTVIGIGHIGLPLALTIDKNTTFQVQAFDVNEDALAQLIVRSANFMEDGIDELLQTHQVHTTTFIQKSEVYIVTVGTPVSNHFQPDTSMVSDVVWHLFEQKLMDKSLLVLRSTVPIGYTMNIAERALVDYGMVINDDYYLAYCPERIAEGVALKELESHPQLIGTDSVYDASYYAAQAVFRWVPCHSMTFKEAEFAKLATNTYRAMHFAVASYLQMAGMKHGVDFISVRDTMMEGYPRLKHLPKPGFTAGPCLRKDFAMLGRPGDLAFQSYMVNEEYPRWVAETSVWKGAKVVILGAGFKDNSDDVRDSLVETLFVEVRHITGEDPIVVDPALPYWHRYTFSNGEVFVNNDVEFLDGKQVDVVIFGNPLSQHLDTLEPILRRGAIFVDPSGYFADYQLNTALNIM